MQITSKTTIVAALALAVAALVGIGFWGDSAPSNRQGYARDEAPRSAETSGALAQLEAVPGSEAVAGPGVAGGRETPEATAAPGVGTFEVAQLERDESRPPGSIETYQIGPWRTLHSDGLEAAVHPEGPCIYRSSASERAAFFIDQPTLPELETLAEPLMTTMRLEVPSTARLRPVDHAVRVQLLDRIGGNVALGNELLLSVHQGGARRSLPVHFEVSVKGAEEVSISGLHRGVGYVASISPSETADPCSDLGFGSLEFQGGDRVIARPERRALLRVFLEGDAIFASDPSNGRVHLLDSSGQWFNSYPLAFGRACIPVRDLEGEEFTVTATGPDWIVGTDPVPVRIRDGAALPDTVRLTARRGEFRSVFWSLQPEELGDPSTFLYVEGAGAWVWHPVAPPAGDSGVVTWVGSEARFLGAVEGPIVAFNVHRRNWIEAVQLGADPSICSVPPSSEAAKLDIVRTAVQAVEGAPGAIRAMVVAESPPVGDVRFRSGVWTVDLEVSAVDDLAAYAFEAYDELVYTVRLVSGTDHSTVDFPVRRER